MGLHPAQLAQFNPRVRLEHSIGQRRGRCQERHPRGSGMGVYAKARQGCRPAPRSCNSFTQSSIAALALSSFSCTSEPFLSSGIRMESVAATFIRAALSAPSPDHPGKLNSTAAMLRVWQHLAAAAYFSPHSSNAKSLCGEFSGGKFCRGSGIATGWLAAQTRMVSVDISEFESHMPAGRTRTPECIRSKVRPRGRLNFRGIGRKCRKIARSLKRSEGATRQKAFSLGVSLDSRA